VAAKTQYYGDIDHLNAPIEIQIDTTRS